MISSHAPPRTFVKSRENLQELSKNSKLLEKFAAFDSVLNAIWFRAVNAIYAVSYDPRAINRSQRSPFWLAVGRLALPAIWIKFCRGLPAVHAVSSY